MVYGTGGQTAEGVLTGGKIRSEKKTSGDSKSGLPFKTA